MAYRGAPAALATHWKRRQAGTVHGRRLDDSRLCWYGVRARIIVGTRHQNGLAIISCDEAAIVVLLEVGEDFVLSHPLQGARVPLRLVDDRSGARHDIRRQVALSRGEQALRQTAQTASK